MQIISSNPCEIYSTMVYFELDKIYNLITSYFSKEILSLNYSMVCFNEIKFEHKFSQIIR